MSAPAPRLPNGKPDPKAYTKPWTVTEQVFLQPDADLMEFICNENNRDLPHLPSGLSR
jgi:hypothetical protein